MRWVHPSLLELTIHVFYEGREKMSAKQPKEEKGSFWSTLPGIITAITGLVVAITGLITVLGDEGILSRLLGAGGDSNATPTAFPTATSVDEDVILPTVAPATPAVTSSAPAAPVCDGYIVFEGKSNPNAILLAFSETEFWVRYAELEETVIAASGIDIYIFDTSASSGACLREWVKYLAVDHRASWPVAETGKGRTYHEVWMNSPTPPLVGDLAGWSVLPDMILIAVVDDLLSPDFVQVYECGQDIPRELLDRVAYWHSATSEQALEGHLDLYGSNGYEIRETVSCKD
jgi:hypothetical protein